MLAATIENIGALMRKLLLFLVCVGALPCASLGQTNKLSWANLSGLQPGQNIQVIDTSSNKHAGAFVRVSDAAIALRLTSGEQSIQKQDVRSVKLMQNKHRVRNTVIGAAIGAAAGAGILAATWENHGFVGGKGDGAAVGAAIGSIMGGVVGVLIPSHSTIYTSP
jgi:hypothetical protein